MQKLLKIGGKISMNKLIIIVILLLFSSFCFSQTYGSGLIFSDDDDYRDIPLASTPMMGELQPSKDLSGWFPSPGNQGMQSSCVGWAIAYALKSYQEAVEKGKRPTTASDIFSPAYIYNQIKTNGCQGGSSIIQALELVRREGVSTLSDFPYSETDCNSIPSKASKTNARSNAIADWRRVNFLDPIEVKSQISAGFPVIIGMYIDEGFQALQNNQIYNKHFGRELGGHAMVVVGYDDTREAYKVINSWGRMWGDSGFGWVSYSMFKKTVKEAYTAQDVVILDPNSIETELEKEYLDIDVPEPVNNIDSSVKLSKPIVIHNVPISTPSGLFPGMSITVHGKINNARGDQGQLIVRFYQLNGSPLLANAYELYFRDAHGLVATGTPVMPVINDPADISNIQLQIPYFALNFKPMNGLMQYRVLVVASFYVNKFEKAKSSPTEVLIHF